MIALRMTCAWYLQILFGKRRKPPATCRTKNAENGTLEKAQQKQEVKTIANKKSQGFHLFYAVGDNEIQIESRDKKRNKDILKLAASVPDAVTFFDADYAPYYLRAAVKAENVSLRFKPALSESARKVRAENGRRNVANLKNSKQSKSKQEEGNP